MQIALSVLDIKVHGSRNLDAELKFCRSALARGNSLAMPGQLESAARDVWVVQDTAEAVKSLLTKMEDAEGLDRLVIQLTEVRRGLNDLRRYLDIPPVADWPPLQDQLNGRLPATGIRNEKGAISVSSSESAQRL